MSTAPATETGEPADGCHPLPCRALRRAAAVTLATTAGAVICARVPSVYRSFGCQDGSWAGRRRKGCWLGAKAL